MVGDEVDGIDEEFLFHLKRGSELLLRGDADGARASLERALELRSKDAKVLGLLGQAYYRLLRFDEAVRVWQRLVDDNPVEPSARVNLGLASLKAKRYLDAVKQLEIALDLNPDHKKAMGYLGLALLESGNLTAAREWFLKAGSDQMVARCDDLIAGRSAPPQQARESSAPAEVPEPPPSPEPMRPPAEAPPERAMSGTVLGAWAAARLVHRAPGEAFSTSAEALSIAVRGELRVRLDGLFATHGQVSMTPEMKRFRGRATTKPFGEGAMRVYRVSGDGVLLYRTHGRRFNALELGSDAAYLRQEVLFGFEDGVAFENGRVPSSLSAELNLVHLRGRGQFLLATTGDPVAVDVSPNAPLKLPLTALVGWIGALTPRVCALLDDATEPPIVAVELAGEGRVLADPSAGIGAPAPAEG